MADLHRSVASLRIFGDKLDPENISRVLGASPTFSYRKGDAMNRTGIVRKSGAWLLEAKDREPEDLDTQVDEILGQLTSDLTIWTALESEYKIDLFCGFFMKETDEGLNISVNTMKALADRGIKLGICLYAPSHPIAADATCPCESGLRYGDCCALKMA